MPSAKPKKTEAPKKNSTQNPNNKKKPSDKSKSKPTDTKSSKSKKKRSKTEAQKVSCSRKFFAILTRVLFLLHTSVAIWRVALVYDEIYIYFLSIGAFLLVMEMVYTLAVRGGIELKWYCPSVFFYLLSVIPCLWFLEMTEIEQITKASPLCNITMNSNFSTTAATSLLRNRRDVTEASLTNTTLLTTTATLDELLIQNSTIGSTVINSTNLNGVNGTYNIPSFDDIENKIGDAIHYIENTTETIKTKLNGFFLNLNRLEPRNWKLALHQTLLFVLVIGRWLLPKGEITREQLSQLLLVFIGVGADILEFVTETIDEEHVFDCEYIIIFFLYTTWTCSLFQFTLVLTASKSRKTRIGFEDVGSTKISRANNCCARSIFNSAEVWGILVTMFLQDIPFLVFRLYVMIVYEEIQQMMIFFTGKNALVVILQIYRLIVLKMDKEGKEDKKGIPEEELIPLRGYLQNLTKQTGHASRTIHENFVQDASFKTKATGDVVVTMTLDGGTLKRNKSKLPPSTSEQYSSSTLPRSHRMK